MALSVSVAVWYGALLGPLVVSELTILIFFSPPDGGQLLSGLAWKFILFDAAVILIRYAIFSGRNYPGMIRALIAAVPYLAFIGRLVLSR
jgi:hypothetical protein